MNTDEQKAPQTQPTDSEESNAHGLSSVFSGDPIEIECALDVESGTPLKVILRLHGVIYSLVNLMFYPMDADDFVTAVSAGTIHESEYNDSRGQDINPDLLVPSVNRLSEYGILTVGFDHNKTYMSSAHKSVFVSPKSSTHTITFTANDTHRCETGR